MDTKRNALPSRTDAFVAALTEDRGKRSAEGRGIRSVPDNAYVICVGVRTPITKAGRGGLKDMHADQLLAAVLRQLLLRVPQLETADIGDCQVGSCLQPGGGQAMARMGAFEASLPYTVPVAALNRQCSSGLQAIASVVGGLAINSYAVGIAAGVESMSSCSFENATPAVDWESVKASPLAAQCMIPMGITSEKVAKRYEISRQSQDAYAVSSHMRAAAAQADGAFDDEIVPVGGVVKDEMIRPDCNAKSLNKLASAFKKKGTTTAGNSSPLSDGASAVIVTTEKERGKLQLPSLCLWRAYAVVGVPPDIMGVGPAFAIPALLKQYNHNKGQDEAYLELADIDVFEINEAFASQVLFCIDFLRLDAAKVNPQGGAIALGHPLGCSGNRMVVTCANYLKRIGLRYGVVSMCVGTGMGAAALIENPDFYAQTVKSRL